MTINLNVTPSVDKVNILSHTHMHTYTHACTNALMHAHTHTHTHTHIDSNTVTDRSMNINNNAMNKSLVQIE